MGEARRRAEAQGVQTRVNLNLDTMETITCKCGAIGVKPIQVLKRMASTDPANPTGKVINYVATLFICADCGESTGVYLTGGGQ